MTYWMYRERDGRGDSGSMSMALVPTYDENGKVADIQYIHNARPQVGYVMRVGSNMARSYSAQDWWQTTAISEILEDTVNEDGSEYVKFKTGNSIYEWRNN
jgi:hypothetical protein